jgi:nucleolar protein 8
MYGGEEEKKKKENTEKHGEKKDGEEKSDPMDIEKAAETDEEKKKKEEEEKKKEEEEKKKKEEEEKKFGRGGWGTSAYMLMYRRIDPAKNVQKVDDAEIPVEILDEVLKENEEFLIQKEKYKERKDSYGLKIYYGDNKYQTVIVHKLQPFKFLMVQNESFFFLSFFLL